MNRIVTIDIAKAIGIILVVVGHYIPDDNAPQWYIMLRAFIYSFHMPLFMFASGFIYMATRKDVGYVAFLRRKFHRLLIPYISTSFIVITLKLLLGNAYVREPVTLLSYAKIFYRPEAGHYLWFIWALWWMFVIVPLCRQRAQRLALLVAGAVLAYVPFSLTEVFCLQEFKEMLVYFMLGVVMAEHRNTIWPYARKWAYVVYILFAGAEVLLLSDYDGGAWEELTPYLGIAAVLCVSHTMAKHKGKRVANWLIAVSGSSYIIYLFHTTFLVCARSIVQKVGVESEVWFAVSAACVVAVSVLLPILLHRYVLARYKITRSLFGLA